MSSGTQALKALLEALEWEIEEAVPTQSTGTLRTVLRALKAAVNDMESSDYDDYMGQDL